MRAVHIFACVAMLVAIASADEEEEDFTLYISEEAEVIYECPGGAVEQCAEQNGVCVEDGGHCNGIFNIINNSCYDHCSCCLPAGTDLSTLTAAKGQVIPVGSNLREDHHCGTKYPLPNGEPAECNYLDPAFPCCSFFGWCGNTDEHCTCDECIDYREQRQEDTQGCPDGFFMIDGSHQCFKFFNDEDRTWGEANTKCEEEGLQMAEPVNQIAVTLRKHLLDTYGDGGAWLGARGDGTNYVWQNSREDLDSYSELLRPGLEGSDILRSHCLGLVVTKGAYKRFSERPYGSRACSRDYYTLCEKVMGGRSKKSVGGSQSGLGSSLH